MPKQKGRHSFSPPFNDFTTYGDKEVPPQHHQPYAKRADLDNQPDPKTLSPHVRNTWVITPAASMDKVIQAKKEENKRLKSALEAALPVAKKMERTFQVISQQETQDQPTKIDVLQEDTDDNNDEEEKLPPTPVACFLAQETDDEKFPWALINAETGLVVAFYKHKTTDFASHLEGGEELRKQRMLELELYGKTPLYQAQKYRKKAPDSQEIIYHWASVKVRRAVRAMLGLISIPESIEMITKHETPQEFRLVNDENSGGFTIMIKRQEAAIGEMMDDGKLRLTIKPLVDPTLIIIFLAVTGSLTPST